jgi:selenocysteine lyase/cysteine desulfurase
MITFGQKKCHVRVYATITYDGRAFVHQRAFLHVANENFELSRSTFDDTVHITNCCANSHDDNKFAGEILADFSTTTATTRDGQTVVPLSDFFPSVKATISVLCQRAFAFLEGGQRNNGFEYCGMDFMLSHDAQGTPLAYLLEINAPPSQDTATGLPHAENLHNDVLHEWMTFWVVPRVTGNNNSSSLGGWKCVHTPEYFRTNTESDNTDDLILPSKAAILNKIRWGLFEKKALKRDQEQRMIHETPSYDEENDNGTQQPTLCELDHSIPSPVHITRFARLQFPYFTQQQTPPIFFENAGGAQVPQSVIDCMAASLQCRHRSIVGWHTKEVARATAKVLLGATRNGAVVFGSNATGLLESLAWRYTQCNLLSANDEVVLSTENHRANFEPWIKAAAAVGARVKLWSPSLSCATSSNLPPNFERSAKLHNLITSHTRIVAIPHASNVLGVLLPIKDLSNMIKMQSHGHAHVVVDGVAAVPHMFADFDSAMGNVDWYVVSMHKLFGPHIGVLLANQGGAMDALIGASQEPSSGMMDEEKCLISIMEKGTLNIEGCAGIMGLGSYFKALANIAFQPDISGNGCCSAGETGEKITKQSLSKIACDITFQEARRAYSMIRKVENWLVEVLMQQLSCYPRVKILKCAGWNGAQISQLPIISFVHLSISSKHIVQTCSGNAIICRNGAFLSTPMLLSDYGIANPDGVVRISLAHYNTEQEVRRLIEVLEAIPCW